jgi:hypothetical protein
MFRVNVSLPSGRSETLLLPEHSTVGDLQVLAQQSFGQKFLRLVTSTNRALTQPMDSLQAAGIQDGEHLTGLAQRAKIAATRQAIAAWCCGGDRIVTWGSGLCGGDSSRVKNQLKNIQQVQATKWAPPGAAFAAILANGSVVTWGDPKHGGNCSSVRNQLRNVQQVEATGFAFAAILDDGSLLPGARASMVVTALQSKDS